MRNSRGSERFTQGIDMTSPMMDHRWIAKAVAQKAIYKLGLLSLYHWLQKRGGRLRNFHPNERVPGAWKLYVDVQPFVPLAGASVVEIGTGWVPIVPLTLHLMGAGSVRTYDLSRHLQPDLTLRCVPLLRDCVDLIVERTGLDRSVLLERLERLEQAKTVEELFQRAGITYFAPADASRTDLPDSSVDILCSNLVMEHVIPEAIDVIHREARRILKPNGVCWHQIDYTDHYSHTHSGLSEINFLRYGNAFWDLVGQNDILWQSRQRDSKYREQFQKAGFTVAASIEYRSPAIRARLGRIPLAAEFAGCSDYDLEVTGARIVLRKAPG